MSNHDLRILENRRSSVPASRFVSASQSLNNQPMARTLSAVGGAMSAGGEKRFNSQPSVPHLNIPDLANFTKPTFTRSRSWRELKSWKVERFSSTCHREIDSFAVTKCNRYSLMPPSSRKSYISKIIFVDSCSIPEMNAYFEINTEKTISWSYNRGSTG